MSKCGEKILLDVINNSLDYLDNEDYEELKNYLLSVKTKITFDNINSKESEYMDDLIENLK